MSAALAPVRRAALEKSLGHYPALFAILDCVEFGLPQRFEGAIRSEMTSFTHLILRPEPRAMIQRLFLGRVDYERLERKRQLPEFVEQSLVVVRSVLDHVKTDAEALAAAGFEGLGGARVAPVRERERQGYWIDGDDPRACARWRSSNRFTTSWRRSPRDARGRNCVSQTTPRSARPAIPVISAGRSRSEWRAGDRGRPVHTALPVSATNGAIPVGHDEPAPTGTTRGSERLAQFLVGPSGWPRSRP